VVGKIVKAIVNTDANQAGAEGEFEGMEFTEDPE
jgi:hypothetical protein